MTQLEENSTSAPFVQKIREFKTVDETKSIGDFVITPLDLPDREIAFSDFCFVHRQRPFILEYLGKNIRSDPKYVMDKVVTYAV